MFCLVLIFLKPNVTFRDRTMYPKSSIGIDIPRSKPILPLGQRNFSGPHTQAHVQVLILNRIAYSFLSLPLD